MQTVTKALVVVEATALVARGPILLPVPSTHLTFAATVFTTTVFAWPDSTGVPSQNRVYRNEEINARKYPLFHQVEGLLIDKDVTFGQLKGTLTAFIQTLFQKPVKNF